MTVLLAVFLSSPNRRVWRKSLSRLSWAWSRCRLRHTDPQPTAAFRPSWRRYSRLLCGTDHLTVRNFCAKNIVLLTNGDKPMRSAKKRVLIIDDEASFTRLLKLNLHHTGHYTAETVNDPTKALAVARDFSPDVILLDVMMPSMDGGEVAARMQANPKLRETPIVFLTAAVKRNEIASHQGCIGGLPFIAKPIDFQEVVDCIEKQLRRSPTAPGKC